MVGKRGFDTWGFSVGTFSVQKTEIYIYIYIYIYIRFFNRKSPHTKPSCVEPPFYHPRKGIIGDLFPGVELPPSDMGKLCNIKAMAPWSS